MTDSEYLEILKCTEIDISLFKYELTELAGKMLAKIIGLDDEKWKESLNTFFRNKLDEDLFDDDFESNFKAIKFLTDSNKDPRFLYYLMTYAQSIVNKRRLEREITVLELKHKIEMDGFGAQD